jgi:SAM-dependent methyltransferase
MALLTSRCGLVLDVGCGIGILAPFLSPHTVYIDFSHVALEHVNLDNAVRINASAEDLPFRNNLFEQVLAVNLVEHLDNPPRFFAESHRVLRDDGQLIFSYPSSSRTKNHKHRRITMQTLNSWCAPHFTCYKFFERYGLKRLVVVAYKYEDL